MGPVNVKGLRAPVEVYELTGASPVRSRFRGIHHAWPDAVGWVAAARSARYVRHLTRAGDGHGQIVAVVGEPGVGKSRLLHEFVHSHRFVRSKGQAPSSDSSDWLVVESGSVSYGKATSYLPVIDLLKAYFEIDARDDGRKIREKVTGKLLTLDETLRPLLPALLGLLDVPVEDRRLAGLRPARAPPGTRTRRSGDCCSARASASPCCLVVEDLHWIDAETQAVLDGLVESLPAARLLLLDELPPGVSPPLGAARRTTARRASIPCPRRAPPNCSARCLAPMRASTP